MLRTHLGWLLLAASLAACGEKGIEGAWVACEDTCFELENDGVLFRDDGTALEIDVESSARVDEMTFCEETDDPVTWELDGDKMTIVDGDDTIIATYALNEDRLTISVLEMTFQYQRIDEDNSNGPCPRPVPLQAGR
jgi:hypothetical protein